MKHARALACGVGVLAAIASLLQSPARAAAVSDWRDVRLEVQQVSAAGTTFAYAEVGSGSPLLMLNGTGSPMAEWDPALLAQLAQNHRVIVFDYPGLGLSGQAPGRWRFPAAADWISEFVSAVVPETSVDVLGWSMGGFIAQQLAIRHPNQVHHLVLAATNPGGDKTTLGPRWVQQADSDPDYTIKTYLSTNYPHTRSAQAAGRAFVRRLTVAVNAGRYPEEQVPTRTYDAMVAAEDPWLRSNANYEQLAQVAAPTLVITGAQDVITPPANSRQIARAVAGSSLVLVKGAGHSFVFQKPELVTELIDAFLLAQP